MYFKNLKDAREDHDMTQQQVAIILGHSQSYYAKLEKGIHNISAEDIYKLAVLYKESADYLLGITNVPLQV